MTATVSATATSTPARESFLARLLAYGMDKRDQVNNLNFFMYVPLDERGNLNFADGISSPGKYIELEAEDERAGACLQLSAVEQSLQRL